MKICLKKQIINDTIFKVDKLSFCPRLFEILNYGSAIAVTHVDLNASVSNDTAPFSMCIRVESVIMMESQRVANTTRMETVFFSIYVMKVIGLR